MKRLVSFGALVALFAGGLVAAPAQAAATVGWDVPTLDWALTDNTSTVYTDLVVREKARLRLTWDQATESANCVAWHIDSSGTASYTHTISSTTETRTSNANLFAGGTLRESELVYTWSELADKFSLDTTAVMHNIRVDVHNTTCDLADIGAPSESIISSSELWLTVGPADSQDLDMFAELALDENVNNATEQPDLGGTANADKWIYQGESALFDATYLSGASLPWNGPIMGIDGEIPSANVCFIDVVNIDDAYVDPETGNVSQGYDFMNVGWISEGVTSNVGDSDYTYYDPKYVNSSTTVGWNSVIANGWSDWDFNPSKNNSITRFMFEGGCYDIMNYGTASASSTDPNVPVDPNTNYSSTTRYSNDTESDSIGYYGRWNYYWHGRTHAEIAADFWAMRATALDSETVYLGPANASISENNEVLDSGDSVDIDTTWFDGDNQCVALFIDGVYENSWTPGEDGSGTSSEPYTWLGLIADYSLDPTVTHDVEWRLFNGSCASIDETTATPMDAASIDLNPGVSTLEADVESIDAGGEVNVDITFYDGDNQCLAFYVDGEFQWSMLPGADGPNADVTGTTWEAIIEGYNLDPAAAHTIEWRIFDGACDDIDLNTATPLDSVEVDLNPVVPTIDFDTPEIGPDGNANLDFTWADPYQCLAFFIDGEFASWEYLEGDTGNGVSTGSESWPGTWREWIDFAESEWEADLDLTVEHLIEYRIYDDFAPCFTEGTPSISDPFEHGTELNLLPLAPVLEPSVDEVGPGGTSDLDIDRDTYGGLLAAQYIDGVFVGCAVVSEIPTVIDWAYLDDSYSRDDTHDVTFQVFPFFGDEIDMNLCDEAVFANLTPITEGTVYLVPDAVEPEEELAETGVDANGIAWIAFLTLATGAALIARRRRETVRS